MRRGAAIALATSLLVGCSTAPATPERGVLSIEWRMTPEREGELQSSLGSNVDIPVEARLDGERFGATVRVAGSSSQLHVKHNFNMDLDRPSKAGIRSFRLASSPVDRSMLRIPLAFDVFARADLPTPEVIPAALTVNGRYWGLYYLVEKVDEEFFTRRGLPLRGLFKAFNDANFAPGMSAHVDDVYEAKSDTGLAEIQRLAAFVETAAPDRFETEIFSFIDRADVARYVAASVVTDNYDGFNKNVYFWSPAPGTPLRIVPWDVDRTWLGITAQGRVWLDNVLFERLFAIDGFRDDVLLLVSEMLARDDSVERFEDRLAMNRERIARAYADDPALGGLRGWSLEDEAAALLRDYADWTSRLTDPSGADVLDAR